MFLTDSRRGRRSHIQERRDLMKFNHVLSHLNQKYQYEASKIQREYKQEVIKIQEDMNKDMQEISRHQRKDPSRYAEKADRIKQKYDRDFQKERMKMQEEIQKEKCDLDDAVYRLAKDFNVDISSHDLHIDDSMPGVGQSFGDNTSLGQMGHVSSQAQYNNPSPTYAQQQVNAGVPPQGYSMQQDYSNAYVPPHGQAAVAGNVTAQSQAPMKQQQQQMQTGQEAYTPGSYIPVPQQQQSNNVSPGYPSYEEIMKYHNTAAYNPGKNEVPADYTPNGADYHQQTLQEYEYEQGNTQQQHGNLQQNQNFYL